MDKKLNYIPGSMSFSDGFMGPRGDVGFFMSVDENKAKKIVNGLIKKKRKITEAILGLDGDWIENSTIIYDGKFHKYHAHEGSQWATPILLVNFEDSPSETYECWKKIR